MFYSSQIKYIDLFAGIGGFHQAMNTLNAECVFSSEWDKEAAKTYFENYGVKPYGDITKIKEKTYLRMICCVVVFLVNHLVLLVIKKALMMREEPCSLISLELLNTIHLK